jgi:hypothetical protein
VDALPGQDVLRHRPVDPAYLQWKHMHA